MKYVAFLRGINVGGKNKVEMRTLHEMCAALGYENVVTYINSGNVIFETNETDDNALAAEIERAIQIEFSLDIKVMARTIDEIRNIVKNNPFDRQFENDKNLHFCF
jgi:uncharacterized protein (DUF1697 family)